MFLKIFLVTGAEPRVGRDPDPSSVLEDLNIRSHENESNHLVLTGFSSPDTMR